MSGLFFFLAVLLIIALLVGWVYLNREVLDPKGKGASKSAGRMLSSFALLRGFKTLKNVSLPGGVVIENLLIGYFGVLIVRTLGMRGEYYGTLDAGSWSVAAKGKKTVIDNPLKLLEREEAALRAVFAKNKIYSVPVEHVVYISSKSSKTSLYITHGGEILTGGKLAGYLEKTKFEKDAGIDVKKITDAILAG